MPKQGVKTYRAGSVEWLCGLCENVNSDSITEDAKRLEEYDQYQNYQFQCQHCSGWIFVNMNIPENEFEEFDLEVEHMDFFEINARKQIRDMIFEHREDMKALKKKDKEAKRNSKKENVPHWRNEMHGKIMIEEMDRKRRKFKKDKGGMKV